MAVLIVAALVARYVFSAPAGRPPVPHPPIVIETEHLDVLPPHEHSDGDSVSDTWHHITRYSPVLIAPRDLYLKGVTFEYFGAPTSTVHHTSFADTSRKNATCPNLRPWYELFSYSSDRMFDDSIRFPEGYALLVKKGTPLQLYLMVHNPDPPLGPGGTYHDVYTQMTLIESDADPRTLKLVHPYLLHLDDVPCGFTKTDESDSLMFTIPPQVHNDVFSGQGKGDAASSKSFETGATLINLTGHLHAWQHTKDVVLYKNDEIMHIFHSYPSKTYPYIFDTPYPTSTFHVDAGDRLWLSATSDNGTDEPARGAMGMAGFYYYLEE